MGRSARSVLLLVGRNFSKWIHNIRFLLLFIVLFIVFSNALDPLKAFAHSIGYAVNPVVAPFLLSSPTNQLLLALGFLFLIADAPFMGQDQLFVINRTGRRTWVAGQMAYVLLAAAAYLAIVHVLIFAIIAPVSSLNIDGWGKVIATLSYTNAASAAQIDIGFPEKIITDLTPLQAFTLQTGLEFLALSFVGLLTFVVNLRAPVKCGVFVSLAVVMFDLLVTNVLPWRLYSFSPFSLARLSVLDFSDGTSLWGPPIDWAIAFGAACLIVAAAATLVSSRRFAIEVTPEL